ncbi:uncharacterized protein AMSG_06731 [Thecamonas trahens ATCC 50062]|uniref:Uncharacterized protein n=1 Tax=Thecamonas trahens ATCC 50062 TaxID=461836 RepID=A0A0L0DHP9_THETB|nr:hypothetical protein AMSG_06731 [Thecamonas trahens ATCC 50062]KNC50828.1 hypothetical protein AMSG_06731 [Thecamonas trahens ATCC 50062]|eukprot:XP_013756783.1 hypothetical protein AMSG_06731 [Thecamonas trahens ATCC 50062]
MSSQEATEVSTQSELRQRKADHQPGSASHGNEGEGDGGRGADDVRSKRKKKKKRVVRRRPLPPPVCFFPWYICLLLLALPFLALFLHGQMLLLGTEKPLDALPKHELVSAFDFLGDMHETLYHWYAGPAMNEMIRKCQLKDVWGVLEFGPGNGGLAQFLLDKRMPANATYEGFEVSEKMFHTTVHRVSKHLDTGRACIRWKRDDDPRNDLAVGRTRNSKHGSSRLNWKGFDAVIATYVLDKIPPSDIEAIISYAHKEVRDDYGRVCLVSQTRGNSLISTFVTSMWSSLYAIYPPLLAGSRPIRTRDYLPDSQWKITHHNVISKWGVASEVVIAEKIPPPPPTPVITDAATAAALAAEAKAAKTSKPPVISKPPPPPPPKEL